MPVLYCLLDPILANWRRWHRTPAVIGALPTNATQFFRKPYGDCVWGHYDNDARHLS